MVRMLKITRYIFTVLILTTVFTLPSFAADDDDFQYWSTVGFSFDIDKDWTFAAEEEFRFSESGHRFGYHHTNVGLIYKSLADWMDIGFNYKQIFEKSDKGEWLKENRPHFNIILKTKLLDLSVSNRFRVEYRDREQKDNFWRYRNKVTIKLPSFTEFNLKPYLADEVYINLDGTGYSKNRLYSGFSFALAKDIKFDVYYLWQSSRSGSNQTDINVIGTKLKFSF